MKNKKSISFAVFAGLIFCILYIILASKPLQKEYHFTPEWKLDITNPTVTEPEADSQFIPFKLGQRLGYFTKDGTVVNFVTYPQKASISNFAYTYYSNNNSNATVYLPNGKEKFKIAYSGFPMIDKDKIFLFLPGGTSFARITEEGEKQWEYSGPIPITAFDSSKSASIAGFADGSLCEFNNEGNILLRFSPGGSDLPVILGAAVSNSGTYIAALAGHGKQRFILAKREGTQAKIIHHEFLDCSSARQTIITFSEDDSTVYFNSDGIFGITDVKSGKTKTFKISGQVLNVQESKDSVFVLSKKGKIYTVYIVEKFATLTGSFSFEASNAFIQIHDEHLYVGKDTTISSILIEKK